MGLRLIGDERYYQMPMLSFETFLKFLVWQLVHLVSVDDNLVLFHL